MLLFRSEEHAARWCQQWCQPPGAFISSEQLWGLARAWYTADRRDPAWRRHSPDEAEQLFAALGLSGDFWSLRGP